jgi:hypothetical protein
MPVEEHSSPGLFASARHGRYEPSTIDLLMEALKSEQEAHGWANCASPEENRSSLAFGKRSRVNKQTSIGSYLNPSLVSQS